jgi:hypothetical protein
MKQKDGINKFKWQMEISRKHQGETSQKET